jgi:Ca-activated chloride channel family protein
MKQGKKDSSFWISSEKHKIRSSIMGKYQFCKKMMGLLSFLFFSLISGNLFADGFIVPKPRQGENIPPLTVKYHRVSVDIVNQVAKTSIDQVFINNYSRDIEGIFIFPLPEGGSISEFAMYIGEERVEGEILDKDQARRIYEDIVRRLRDPALLEYIGRNMFRARVYPIPAGGEKRIQLSYSEILKSEANLVHYVYPLNTEQFSLHPIQQVSVSAKVVSKVPISGIYSPSHKISVRREGEKEARVSFEASNVKPDTDFSLFYSLTEDEIGLSFMNWEGPDDKYFMLLASPPYVSRKQKIINKNLIFVLDSSGSMSGKKIIQAKEAVQFIINHLEQGDMFSLVDFDDGVDEFSSRLVSADSENREKALRFVDQIEDSGGTNINDALLRALKMVEQEGQPSYILFLTDGLPTAGITKTSDVLRNVSQANSSNTRIFVFGVGNDVNTELLDRLSLDNRGTSVYLSENEDLEVGISSFYEKISSPLLSDIQIDFGGDIRTRDTYPRILPDLFKGSQLILIGKYSGDGPVTVTLTGKVDKKERTFKLENQKLEGSDSYDFLPRLWATRRVGYLLEEIRLHGEKEELVQEVKKLGLKFGIVTPYTSYLVTEKERDRLDAAAPEAVQAFTERKVTGAGGVKMARATQQFKDEEQTLHVESQRIRYKEDKTFYLKDKVWVDSSYEEESPVREVIFNSQEFYRLISEMPGIAAYLSVARNIIIRFEGVNYKIVDMED